MRINSIRSSPTAEEKDNYPAPLLVWQKHSKQVDQTVLPSHVKLALLIGGTDPPIWSTTGGPFTVSRVLENNSAYSSIRFSIEFGVTLRILTNRMSNGSNQFLPSRLYRLPLTTKACSGLLKKPYSTVRNVAPNTWTTPGVSVPSVELFGGLILYSSASVVIKFVAFRMDFATSIAGGQWGGERAKTVVF
ncbi:hypothetical protein T07_13595 [Trichinella nelsoni]|uniref:Uncharacterized protein n=1 Tax=Trichinella nelsoni TaxID=6336 RepID=A0A0V0RHJ1_9BILA|nr:hypothetical protein T07_13595 [Trichinella nelsoni]